MSLNKYNSTTGQLENIASGARTWVGTKAAYESARQAGTLPTNCLIAITDDDKGLAQEVTEGDPRAVTSGAVYNAIGLTTAISRYAPTGDDCFMFMRTDSQSYFGVNGIIYLFSNAIILNGVVGLTHLANPPYGEYKFNLSTLGAPFNTLKWDPDWINNMQPSAVGFDHPMGYCIGSTISDCIEPDMNADLTVQMFTHANGWSPYSVSVQFYGKVIPK